MMRQIGIYEAKTHFSQLIQQVSQGDEFMILRGQVPVAKLIPLKGKPKRRKFGSAKGKINVPDSFFDPLPDSLMKHFQ